MLDLDIEEKKMKEEIEALKKDSGDLETIRERQRNRIEVIFRKMSLLQNKWREE